MKFRRIAAVVLFCAISAVNVQALELVEPSCVSNGSNCRSAATAAFYNDEVGVVRYSLLLTGCDMAYGVCSMSPI